MVGRPEDWPWSSDPGVVDPARRPGWVAYDAPLSSRRGGFGGDDPASAYRRFVEAGRGDPPPPPFRGAFGGWALGSPGFMARLRAPTDPPVEPPATGARRLAGLDPAEVGGAVAAHYGLEPAALADRHGRHVARPLAAWLCRRHTDATLRDLAALLGLTRADSVPNLTRRIDARLKASTTLAGEVERIRERLVTAVERKYAFTA